MLHCHIEILVNWTWKLFFFCFAYGQIFNKIKESTTNIWSRICVPELNPALSFTCNACAGDTTYSHISAMNKHFWLWPAVSLWSEWVSVFCMVVFLTIRILIYSFQRHYIPQKILLSMKISSQKVTTHCHWCYYSLIMLRPCPYRDETSYLNVYFFKKRYSWFSMCLYINILFLVEDWGFLHLDFNFSSLFHI